MNLHVITTQITPLALIWVQQNPSTFETRQYDFHKMTLAVLKVSFKKQKRRILNYRKYKFYGNSIFRVQFLTKLNHINASKQDNSLKEFQEKCLIVLNLMASITRKFIRANQTPFMNKELLQTIIIRSKLRNKFRREDP